MQKTHKSDPVYELFSVQWPDLSDKVLFEQNSEAHEKASHILGREDIKGKIFFEARAEEEHRVFKKQKGSQCDWIEGKGGKR